MRWVVALALVVGCGGGGSHAMPDGTPCVCDAPNDMAGSGSGSSSGQWVLGYYVGYDEHSLPIGSIDWSALTHIAFAPMVVKNDLTLDFTFDDQDGMGMAHAIELATDAHAHGVKALLMLGGAGAGANIATAASNANRAAFVGRLTSALGTLGYDGIDLDWEDSVDLDELVALAADLRAAKPDIVLSYPAGAINGNFQTVDSRFAQLAASLDRFMVQTYYPSTAVAGQGWDSWFVAPLSGVSGSTPIAVDDTLMRYETAGVPHAKLGIGIGAYAICYTGGISGPRQSTANGVSIVGGDNAYPLRALTVPSGARQYDTTAQQPYLTFAAATADAHCGTSVRYIAYEDAQSIAAKGAWSKQHGYGGVIVWTIEELSPATTTALGAAFK
ncbi:MAG: glycoside hydrolase family 18 protein [Deltaproteobacteria bacterium]|nr:glycoside hydrolase family 18 protein [Deltaproteobacteria bacterium]